MCVCAALLALSGFWSRVWSRRLRERKIEIEKATGKVTAMSGSMSDGHEGYDHTLVECLPSPLGAASGQGEILAAPRCELSEELVRINTHSWVP